jgi:hypothetical protein
MKNINIDEDFPGDKSRHGRTPAVGESKESKGLGQAP